MAQGHAVGRGPRGEKEAVSGRLGDERIGDHRAGSQKGLDWPSGHRGFGGHVVALGAMVRKAKARASPDFSAPDQRANPGRNHRGIPHGRPSNAAPAHSPFSDPTSRSCG